MARLPGSNRAKYTTDRVKNMRIERVKVKAKKDGVSHSQVQQYLGDLQAAGHMLVNGFKNFKVSEEVPTNGVIKTINVEYSVYNEKGMNDRPHFSGYLRSASSVDKEYRLKGWFNEDGTIRLELVK
jgi:hypothetical protein